MREVSLTQGYVTVVDDEDYAPIVSVGKWCASVRPHTTYALHGVRRFGVNTTEAMHTFITGWPFVDHVNGNGLDNRRQNLRPAGKSGNAANSRIRSDNTSGYRGVTWHAGGRKWMAQVVAGGSLIYLGLFVDPIEAARAYDSAAIAQHGEFARLNFPSRSN